MSGSSGLQDNADEGWRAGNLAYKATYDGVDMIAYSQQAADAEQISNEHIFVRGRSWGTAKAILQTGGFQGKIGDCGQYTDIQYTNATLRKYGLSSGILVSSPYQAPAQSSRQQPLAGKSSSDQANPGLSPRSDLRLYKGNGHGKEKAGSRGNSILAAIELPTTFYPKYAKYFSYAFTDTTTYPDFEDRLMLNLVTNENVVDQGGIALKGTLSEYFTGNGAIKKVSRWKEGTTLLDWVYTYAESPGYPTEITITIDPPGAASGIETQIYRNGTLARVEKPGFVEYDRTIYADGLIHSETNQHGGTMTFTYDDIGRITNIAMPSGFNPISASWSQNNVAISRGGNILTKYWDGMGRNLGFEEAGAGVTLFSRRTLDGESRVTAESKGAVNSSHKTIFELNANGQPLQVTDPTGKWTKFAYADNTCTITDMKNNQKVLTYIHLPGLVTRVVQENTQTDSYYRGR